MRFDDSIKLKQFTYEIDDNDDKVEVASWLDLGKCTIFPNTSAKKQGAVDSDARVYSYEVVMRKPKTALPKEGDWIHLKKKDGSVDEDVEVIGFVTLNGRFLKLWA